MDFFFSFFSLSIISLPRCINYLSFALSFFLSHFLSLLLSLFLYLFLSLSLSLSFFLYYSEMKKKEKEKKNTDLLVVRVEGALGEVAEGVAGPVESRFREGRKT